MPDWQRSIDAGVRPEIAETKEDLPEVQEPVKIIAASPLRAETCRRGGIPKIADAIVICLYSLVLPLDIVLTSSANPA